MKPTCLCSERIYDKSDRFCGHCGKSLSRDAHREKIRRINLIIIFFSSILVFITASAYFMSYYAFNLWVELSVEIAFGLLIIGFCFFDKNQILELFKIPKLEIKISQIAIVFPIITGLFVGYFVNSMNNYLFNDWSNYYLEYTHLENPFLWTFIFVAILPPLFEELAFRGYLFNLFKKVTSDKVTIISTAFLFGLIHFSMLSMLWIFPFALVLGYARNRYKTIWLPILIHAIHNLTVICVDYLNYRFYPEDFVF